MTPTDSYYHPSPSAADGHIPSPSVPGSGVPPHLTSTRSIPSDSGISPTPNPTSSPPQSPATSPTPTSPTMSHSHPGNSLSHSPPNSLSHSPPHSPSPSPPPPPSTTVSSDPVSSSPLNEVSTPNQGGSVSGSFEQEVLAAHNNFRQLHGAAALTWDQELATYAENWGSQCNFKHSGGPYGGASSCGLSLLIEDTYVLQRTWLLELRRDTPPATGSNSGQTKPSIITPATLLSPQKPDTSPRSFGRTQRLLDAPLLIALLEKSSQRYVFLRPLLSVDLTCECRVGVSLPCVRVLLTRQCPHSIRVRLLSPFLSRVETYMVFFLFSRKNVQA